MVKDILRSMEGIGHYPSIALIIFFGIFLGYLIWTFVMDKGYEAHMKGLPFDDGNTNKVQNGVNNGQSNR